MTYFLTMTMHFSMEYGSFNQELLYWLLTFLDWADHPARWIQLLKMHIDQQWSMPQNSQKTSERYKTWEMLLTKLVNDYFFGRSSENWKINRKHWENDSWLIWWENNFSKNCWQILSECLEYFRVNFKVNCQSCELLVTTSCELYIFFFTSLWCSTLSFITLLRCRLMDSKIQIW